MRNPIHDYFSIRAALLTSRWTEFNVFTLITLASLSEVLGLSMLFPVIQLLQPEQTIEKLVDSHRLWQFIVAFFGALNVPISLASLLLVSFSGIVVRQAFMYWRVVYVAHLHESIMQRLRDDTFARYLHASADTHDSESPGAVANAMVVELNLGVQAFLNVFSLVAYVVMSISYVGFLIFLSGWITALIIAAIAGAVFILKKLISRTASSGQDMADANEAVMTFLGQRLRSVRFIKLSDATADEISRLRSVTARLYTSNMRIKRSVAAFGSVMEPVALGFGFLFVYLGHQFQSIRLEEAAMFGFIAFMRLLPVSREIIATIQGLLANAPTLRSFLRRYERFAAGQEPPGGDKSLHVLRHALAFKDVDYAYPSRPDQPVLVDVSAAFPAGRLTLLVGPSGAGKSTMLDLIMCLRTPTAGMIVVDGCAIDQFAPASIRRAIAYVSQSPMVLGTTVRDHVSYGAVDLDDSALYAALELAGLGEFVRSLPNGLETRLGEEGALLSGGQRQRLDLARGLARDARILLLDEPTSNLDQETEQNFFATLRRLQQSHELTVILISHELSALSIADQVVVIERGRIEAQGTALELRKQDGWLSRQLSSQ